MISRPLAIRLAFVLLLFAVCFNGMCDKAGRATYGAAVGIGETINIKRDIAAQGELSAEDERVITQGLLDGNTALLQVTDTAECFDEFTTDVKENVLRGLDATVTSLNNLNQSGTLRIKSEKARKRFRERLLYARLTASGVRTTIAILPAKDPSNKSEPVLSEDERRKLDELRALCKRASEQLHENERRLREDLARLQS